MYTKFNFVLSQRRQFFANFLPFFGENIFKIIIMVPGGRSALEAGEVKHMKYVKRLA
jgi:hypothetical protein